MNINSIEITNIKGIWKKKFALNLIPNKPNILVAPNGFGKSSFAIAFDSLKSNKIELDEKNYHLKDSTNRPILSIALSNGKTLIADDTQNTISDIFDIFVINNQIEPKAIIQRFAGKTFAKTTMDIITTTLIQTIPSKVVFSYSTSKIKSIFGANGNKVLNNISHLFTFGQLFIRINREIDFSRFDLKTYKNSIKTLLDEINSQKGTGNQIKNWISSNILNQFQSLDELVKLSNIISSFGFDVVENEVDSYLTAWQILRVKTDMGSNYKKACNYLFYLIDKEHYTKTISLFNPVENRFSIKPIEEKNSLVVKWPKAHEISNGQRDILTFNALLLRSKRDFKKRDCILIIDEIFDYMDDANLVTFQYYISMFIDEMKKQKRRIFPILLTHLDPLFFNHFCFNEDKIKVSYLKDVKIKQNKEILKLIYNRDNPQIKANVDAYFFHYHPEISEVDLSKEFKELNINADWAKPEQFLKKIYREIRRYLLEGTVFDPLAICFGLRLHIEKLVYDKINDSTNKRKFIEEINGTKNKLQFAYNIGIQIPETYFLLGIIYNTSLHLSEGHDISQPLGIKLENNTIKKMISHVFDEKVNSGA